MVEEAKMQFNRGSKTHGMTKKNLATYITEVADDVKIHFNLFS
jgi:hypothetical protein